MSPQVWRQAANPPPHPPPVSSGVRNLVPKTRAWYFRFLLSRWWVPLFAGPSKHFFRRPADKIMAINLLYDNCRKSWPKGVCGFANVCGYISCTIWFVVLVPQIWKNWKRRSVEGLSILWATANFTASLVNCFFAFSFALPVYIRISAVYMPILEFIILLQFWFYSKHSVQMKVSYGAGCFLIWVAVISLELSVNDAKENVQWLAIVLWSIESFPQVGSSKLIMLNWVIKYKTGTRDLLKSRQLQCSMFIQSEICRSIIRMGKSLCMIRFLFSQLVIIGFRKKKV